ncbi:MAG: hypothetical protein ACSLEM_01460 [Candidatus Malihini olakiniferum]
MRGLENNRVSIDINGVELPAEIDRSTSTPSGRAQANSTSISHDNYLDPYLYDSVDIASNATNVSNSNNALGSTVSFVFKPLDNFLSSGKHS